MPAHPPVSVRRFTKESRFKRYRRRPENLRGYRTQSRIMSTIANERILKQMTHPGLHIGGATRECRQSIDFGSSEDLCDDLEALRQRVIDHGLTVRLKPDTTEAAITRIVLPKVQGLKPKAQSPATRQFTGAKYPSRVRICGRSDAARRSLISTLRHLPSRRVLVGT